ncbi:hypothetical protein ADL12_36665 [Streptomyces regalis]|uniref:Uncharacterized protein n=1 Tax=Streptomyces regalis TaxID=68262 RepID=A0A101JD69_9ACTN|nr:hypothetical protein ADL12_36665 [Streptomyces regalis]
MPLLVAYEMTDGRSIAAIGSVASGVLNSGPYQPAPRLRRPDSGDDRRDPGNPVPHANVGVPPVR